MTSNNTFSNPSNTPIPKDVGLELIGLLRDLLGNPSIKENVYDAAFGGAVGPDYPPNIRAAIADLAMFYRQILYSKFETEKELGARLGIQIKTLQNNRSAGVGLPFCKPFGPDSRPIRYHRLITDARIWENCQNADRYKEK